MSLRRPVFRAFSPGLRSVPAILAATILLGDLTSLHAVDLFWDADGDLTADLGGTGDWSELLVNWRRDLATGTLVPWSNSGGDSNAMLTGLPGTLTLLQDISLNDITVDPSVPGTYTVQLSGSRLQLNGARPSVIEVTAGSTLNIASSGVPPILAEAGFKKAGPGTLTFTSGYNLTGPIVLTGGTTITGISTLRGNGITLATGASIVRTNAAITLGSMTGGGALTTGNGTILQTLFSDASFSGSISSSGAYSLRGANGTMQTANGDLTALTGAKTIFTGASLRLQGTGDVVSGVLGGSGAITFRDGSLILDNSAGNTLASGGRISDATAISFRGGGGTLALIGSLTGTTESVGTLTAQAGPVTLSVQHNGGASGTELILANGADLRGQTSTTYNFIGTGGALGTAGANPRIILGTAPNQNTANGMLAKAGTTATRVDTGWAVVNTTRWAGYSPSTGIIALPDTTRDSTTLGSAAAFELTDFQPSTTVTTIGTDIATPAAPLGALKISPSADGQSLDLGFSSFSTTALMLTGTRDFAITGTGLMNTNTEKYIWVTDPNATLGYGGSFAGTGEFVKAGPGTFAVSDSAIFPAIVAMNNGALRAPISTLTGTTRFIFRGTGVLEISGGGTYTPTLGNANAAGGTINFGSAADNTLGNGGFSAFGGDATITLLIGGNPAVPVWGGTDFIREGYALTFGSLKSDSVLTLTNDINLGSGVTSYVAREFRVTDNPNSSTDATRLSGTLSNGNRETELVKTGDGVLQLTGFNTHIGNTIVHEGTLQVGVSGVANGALAGTSKVIVNAGATLRLGGDATSIDRINDAAPFVLAGGTFNPGGLQEGDALNAGLGRLTLTANSILDFAGSGGLLHFAASDSSTWSSETTQFTLSIYNWTNPASDMLFFGFDNTALTQAQLDHIRFFSGEGTGFLGTGTWAGSNGQVTVVPEPGPLGALMIGVSTLLGLRRRRRSVVI
jgi:fibronectin-binding autotransporter adhesin